MTTSEELGLAVKRLQWRHHREGNKRLLAGAGVSLVQWDVLRRLHHDPDSSLHDLAEATFQTDQSMGELARRMVAGGLIRRVDGPGRAVRHALTPDGESARKAGARLFRTVLAETVGGLSDGDQRQLLDLLRRATPE